MSTTSTTNDPSAAPAADPLLDQPSYKGYVLGVLVLGYILNTVDRGALGALVQPIKEELGISDTAMGLLGGLVFAVFYAFMGVPMARLADRWSRVNVLAISITLWSLATAACGAAWNYTSLLVARALTGVGEAGGSPPSHSLISDYFKQSQRATALAVYAMAVPLGVAIGNLVSGWSNVYFGWRMAFVIVGLPGVLVGLLVWLTVKESPRGYADGVSHAKAKEMPPFLEVCKFLWSRRSFVHMSLAAGLHSVVWYAGRIWDNTFFVRSYEMNTGQAGSWLAAFALIGVIGSFAGGFFADRLSVRTGDKRWYMWVPGIGCLVMVPIHVVAYWTDSLTLAVPLFSAAVILASLFFGPSFAVAQAIATVRMRAVATSVLLFFQTMIGYTLGPFIVGALSDRFAPELGVESLRYALVIIAFGNIWAAVHYVIGARRFREDLAVTAALNAAK